MALDGQREQWQTQAPLLLFQGWMTPTTTTAIITRRIMIAMHIHFREFFWSFFAFWSTLVPLWTCSTAVVTWTRFPLTRSTKQCIMCMHAQNHSGQWCQRRSKPDFQCCLRSLLEPPLKPPYQGKSVQISQSYSRHLISSSINLGRYRYTWCKSSSFFSISFTASCLSWISSTVLSTCNHGPKQAYHHI